MKYISLNEITREMLKSIANVYYDKFDVKHRLLTARLAAELNNMILIWRI